MRTTISQYVSRVLSNLTTSKCWHRMMGIYQEEDTNPCAFNLTDKDPTWPSLTSKCNTEQAFLLCVLGWFTQATAPCEQGYVLDWLFLLDRLVSHKKVVQHQMFRLFYASQPTVETAHGYVF
jgi:hypothetical protein